MQSVVWVILAFTSAVVGGWYALYRAGNPAFWRLVARYPNDAYEWFMAEDCWVVVDPQDPSSREPAPRSDFDGPFLLWVPKLGGKKLRIYGQHAMIEESERQFIERITGVKQTVRGRTGGIPWASTLSLLYPIAATLHISALPSTTGFEILGYGIANLGYLLVMAGVCTGTFRVFALRQRWQVFIGAAVALVIGTVLSNLPR